MLKILSYLKMETNYSQNLTRIMHLKKLIFRNFSKNNRLQG